MPKDNFRIPGFDPARMPELALPAELKAAFKKIGQEQKSLAGALVAVKRNDELRARLKRERSHEAIWRLAAEATEAELAAQNPARRGLAPAPAAETPPPQLTVEHSARALVRRFLDQQRMPETSAARIREAMGGRGDIAAPAAGSWTANEAERLNRQLNVPSETTIQRELNVRQASVPQR